MALPDLMDRRRAGASPLPKDTVFADRDVIALSRENRIRYVGMLVRWEMWKPGKACHALRVNYETYRRHMRHGLEGDLDDLHYKLKEESQAYLAYMKAIDTKPVSAKADHTRWLPLIDGSRRVGLPWEFIREYFSHVACPDCHKLHDIPPFQDEILRTWWHPDTKRLVANVPPYHGKTTMFSVWDTIYDLVRDPNQRILIVSKTNEFAKTIIGQIQAWLTDEMLYHGAPRNLITDWGPFRPDNLRYSRGWSKDHFFVMGRTSSEKDPSVLGIGVGQQVYGRRADKIKGDDVATIANQATPQQIAKLLAWNDKELMTRVGATTGKVGYMGTRIMPGDIYGIMSRRVGWKVIRYPAIIKDDPENPQMLWGDHFGFADAEIRRAEMSDADFQMVYQQVELSAEGLAYNAESVAKAKDPERNTGQFNPEWSICGGIDLAGSRKNSGFTVIFIMGVDDEGNRHLIDMHREQSMTPDRIRAVMFHMADMYPLLEYRVETNAMQEQIVQMNNEIVRPLASRGIRIVPHQTQGRNKWNKDFGAESMVPLFETEPVMISIPWASPRDRHIWGSFIDELCAFPLGPTSDTVMAFWFAELACRDWMRRSSTPLFSERRVPDWVAKRRRIIRRTSEGLVSEPIPLSAQRAGTVSRLHGRIRVGETPPDRSQEY